MLQSSSRFAPDALASLPCCRAHRLTLCCTTSLPSSLPFSSSQLSSAIRPCAAEAIAFAFGRDQALVSLLVCPAPHQPFDSGRFGFDPAVLLHVHIARWNLLLCRSRARALILPLIPLPFFAFALRPVFRPLRLVLSARTTDVLAATIAIAHYRA